MAAKTGITPVRWGNCDVFTDISQEKHEELQKLMEKLQNRNRSDNLKVARLPVSNEKRAMEAADRGMIRNCLDKLHSAIKVVSQQTLLERLESIARHLGLTFTLPTPTDKNTYISGEMFKLEIAIDPGGMVRDVKISHQGDAVSCEDVIEVLSQGNFDEFTSHIQGLIDIYKIPGEKKQRSKAFLALQSLEADLNGLAQLQSSIKGVANCIHKSPLGILLPRKGGCPMKLIYFVSPYDLLNEKTKSPHPMTVEAITEHGLGHSVTVCLEQYLPTRRLQTIPLMNVVHQDGKSLPCFQGPTQLNSAVLPACFVLCLPNPIPVALSVVLSIQAVTEINIIAEGEPDTLLNLILNQTAKGKISPGSEFFVTLPDQQHAYYLKDGSGNSLHQQAVMVSRIPFTHPTSVAQVLNHLRQQVLFNTVVGSCVRPYAKQDLASSVIFELVATSLQHFTVTFEHPLQDTMVTAELDLSDLINVKFKVCIGEEDENICSDDTASKIFQRCLSIPVTLRSVIFKVSEKLRKEPTPEPVETVSMEVDRPLLWRSDSSLLLYGHQAPLETIGRPFLPPDVAFGNTLPHAPLKSYPVNASVGNMLPPEPPPPLDSQDRPSSNPLLATLLDQENSPDPEPNPVAESPMLSKLLEDTTPSVSNTNNAANLASSIPTPPTQKTHRGRPPKRRQQSDSGRGKSPKHRMTDFEHGGSFDSDSVNSFDSDVQSQGSLPDLRHHHLSGQSTSSTVIDLTDVDHIIDSPMRKLENFENFIPKNDSRHHHDSDVCMLPGMHNDMDRTKDVDMHSTYHPHSNALPKNEERSTSLEELLTRSGEVSKTKDLTSQLPHVNCVNSKESDSHLLDSLRVQNSNQNAQLQRQLSVESLDSCKSSSLSRSASLTQGYASDSDTLDREGLNSSKSCDTDAFNLIGSKMAANSSGPSSNLEHKNMKDEGKSDGQDLRSLLLVGKKEKQENNFVDKDTKEGKIKMTLPNMVFHIDRSSSNSSELLDITGGKKSSEKTFDFNSDDEEPFHGSMSVISSSSMRLSISNKSKNSKLCYPKYSEKVKRKESKMSESGKRKRDKTEKPVKSRKKKKLDDNRSSSMEVYSATPVESEDKTSTKLKIIKSSLGVSMENSPKTSQSNKDRDKGDNSKKSSKDHFEKYGSSESVSSGKSKSSSQKCLSKNSHGRSLSASSITVSKADSKLMNKTPTIKLKPIAIPTSSSVSVAMTKTPPASSPTQAKAGSLTPTSTTIGRIGAVSLATSGSSKSVTGPPSGGKASTPTSSKTPPSLSKGASIYSGSKNSISTTSGKQSSSNIERKLSQSGRSSSTGNSKGSNGSGKYVSDRKGGSPSLTGNRNTPNSGSSSKSLNSSSKGQSSTSSVFGSKNPATNSLNAASVLSFLNTNESGIASLPRIPKISSASLINSGAKTSLSTASSTAITTASSSLSGSGKTNSYNQQVGGNSRVNHIGTSGGSVNMANKSPIHGNVSSSGKSPIIGGGQGINKQLGSNFNSPANRQSPSTNIGTNRSSPVAGTLNQAKQTVNVMNQNSVNSKTYSGISSNSSANRPVFGVANSTTGSFSAKGGNSSGSYAPVNRVVNSKPQHLHNSFTKNTPASNSPTDRINSSSVSVSASSNSPVLGDAPKRTSNQIVTPPTTSSGSNNAASNKMRPRKSSLSDIVNKLTSAKSTVNSFGVAQEDKKGKFENSIDDADFVETDTSSLSQSSEKEIDRNKTASQKELIKGASVEKGMSNSTSLAMKQRSDSLENDIKSVSKSSSTNPLPENSNRKNSTDNSNLNKTVSKENDNEDTSRNLFASIMKSAYEGFSCSESDKDDKENVARVHRSNDRDNSNNSLDVASQQAAGSREGNPNKKNQSPKPSPKFNGESSNSGDVSNRKLDAEKDVFKVPTPKAPPVEEKDEDTENFAVRKKQRISTTKPVLSPASPASSPENLIIDCQNACMSPRTLQNRTNSPQCNIDVHSNDDGKWTNNTTFKTAKSHAPSPKPKQSPISSPVLQHHSNPSPVSNASPTTCDIDDELMNEAIMGFGS